MTSQYLGGLGNPFTTEAVPGALVQGRSSPPRVAHGLYAELISGRALQGGALDTADAGCSAALADRFKP